jgi:pyrroline-5-carboxylate reductase
MEREGDVRVPITAETKKSNLNAWVSEEVLHYDAMPSASCNVQRRVTSSCAQVRIDLWMSQQEL